MKDSALSFRYLQQVVDARHFWFHLALSDIRNKYRRSSLGIIWAILQPLAMTLLLSYVISSLFKEPMGDYAPYIFIGVVVWEYVNNACIGGCQSFLQSQMYIKQCTHPYIIYTLRHVLAGGINFCLAFLGVLAWIVVMKPENINASWLLLPFSALILFLLLWALATICAFFCTWFHDFSQMIVLLLQALYFISPVLFKAESFRLGNLAWLVDSNPIYHLLALFRMPLLHGVPPSLTNYAFALGTVAASWLIMLGLVRRYEKNLIFYL